MSVPLALPKVNGSAAHLDIHAIRRVVPGLRADDRDSYSGGVCPRCGRHTAWARCQLGSWTCGCETCLDGDWLIEWVSETLESAEPDGPEGEPANDDADDTPLPAEPEPAPTPEFEQDGTTPKGKRWTWVRADLGLLADPELRPASKIVLLALLSRANAEGKCWPSVATLAKDTGCGTTTVWCAIRQLEGCGLVHTAEQRYHGLRTSNLYTVMPYPKRSTDSVERSTDSVGPLHGFRRVAPRIPWRK